MEYLIAFSLALGINLALFVPAFFYKTDKLTDLSYTLSFLFVGVTLFVLSEQTLLHAVLFLMIALWAFRLGGYLFIRIRKTKRDKRFDGVRESFPRFLKFWVLQGLSVFIILLPSIPFFSKGATVLTMLGGIGIAVWCFGFVIEAIADYQKYTFINDPENSGTWIAKGLWKYSRHPNYFGEILVWSGIYLYVLSHLGILATVVGVVSPLYIAYIILFQTGIPTVEKSADERWGDNPAYQAYKKRTSILIPLPRKQIDSMDNTDDTSRREDAEEHSEQR